MSSIRFARKKVLITLGLLMLVGIILQFFRPSLDNSPATAELSAPVQVTAILQRACYDCHSNQTRLAWFDQPVPAYWLVVRDVKAGRKVLNFSTFDSLPKAQQAGKLYEALNQIEFHTMPLSAYTRFHHGAALSSEDISVLRQYLVSLAPKIVRDTAKQRLQLEQFAQWTSGSGGASGAGGAGSAGGGPVPAVAPNGIGYDSLTDFARWKVVSTTERFDNGTMRIILGNPIASQAILEGHTNPWPKGATFAKVALDQVLDSSGVIHSGAFRQVEFMIRDGDKYAATDGWGFARWVGGLAMHPYGKGPGFVHECVNCHQTMADHDHVFTFPLADTVSLYDQAALLPDSLFGRPMAGEVITALVDPRNHSMSTLYGNNIAVKSARSGGGSGYPAGSTLALVTWSQRDDPHWFGGRIPRVLQSIEVVRYLTGGAPSYEYYQGEVLAKKLPAGLTVPDRIAYISQQKAAVLP